MVNSFGSIENVFKANETDLQNIHGISDSVVNSLSEWYLENTNSGGVLTTSTGLGDHLIERLKKADILFEGPEKIA